MELHQVHKTVPPNGIVVLEDIPFEAGEEINILITKSPIVNPENPYPLAGTPYSY